MPTQIKQIIGFACLIWGTTIFMSNVMLWLNFVINSSVVNFAFIVVVAFISSVSGIVGGWKLIKQTKSGFWLTIPFCIYQLVTGYLRYLESSTAGASMESQLAAVSCGLAGLLLLLSLISIKSRTTQPV